MILVTFIIHPIFYFSFQVVTSTFTFFKYIKKITIIKLSTNFYFV